MEEFTEADRNNAVILKICLLGNAGVGKSNISTRFSQDNFNEAYVSTIGVEFQTKLMRCTNNRDSIKKLQIWDTAGQERFRSITQSYIRGSPVICLVYDVTDKESFESIEQVWIPQLKNLVTNENVAIVIVGNKIDLFHQRKVSTEEGESIAAKYQYHFMEISAKEGPESPTKLFQWIVDLMELPVEERKKYLMLETDDTFWTKKMIDLLKTPEFFRNYSDLKIYEPIVKKIAPRLLNQEVIDWIVLNDDILTPAVIQRLVTTAHFFSFDKKGATADNLVHLYLVSHACKFDLLGNKVVECMGSRTDGLTIEDAVKNSPKLIPNNSVVDLNEASMLLIERVHEYKQLKAARKMLPAKERNSDLWHTLIGQLYAERDSTGDFTVIANTQHFKAHKVILAFATSFFELPNDFEVRLNKDISNRAWEQLLKYFYLRDPKLITDPAECLEILSVSSYLVLDTATAPRDHSALLLHCEETVTNSISDDTVLDRLLAADNRQDLVDKKLTMRYLVQHYEQIYAKYEARLAALPKSLMFSVMSRVIQKETKGQGKY